MHAQKASLHSFIKTRKPKKDTTEFHSSNLRFPHFSLMECYLKMRLGVANTLRQLGKKVKTVMLKN